MDTIIYEILQEITLTINKNKDFLTELDREIGDGDHGINMARGFNAVMAKLPYDAEIDMSTYLKKVGMTLLSTVGGASGPLYGSAFLKASSATKEPTTLGSSLLDQILNAALVGIKDRGKAVIGDKTIVDALEPACNAFHQGVTQNRPTAMCLKEAIEAAKKGVEYTKSIVAKKGRASYLGERSLGHQDPGATSTLLILEAIETVINSKRLGE